MQITVLDKPLHLVKDAQHEFLLSNKEVALGYGVTAKTINDHRSNHDDELTEGKHWIRLHVKTNGGMQKVIHWTKKGIVRLGFFIKSKQAKEFRDWAEDYIVNPNSTLDYQRQRENIELKRTLKRLLINSDEIDKLKEQNLKYYEEVDELKRKLQKIKNIL
jgi:prophage antirepressor-like protein